MSLFTQKINWFWGPMQSFDYFKILNKKYNNKDNRKLFLLSSKLISHTIFWIFGPTFLFLMLLMAVQMDSRIMTLFIAVYLLFLVIPGYFAYKSTLLCDSRMTNYIKLAYSMIKLVGKKGNRT